MTTTRVAVVTGAAGGIGRAVSMGLSANYTVVLAGRSKSTLDDLQQEVAAHGGAALAVVCDVTDEDSVMALFDRVHGSYGRVDLLFNNAGVAGPPVSVEEVSLGDWQQVIATNLTGYFLCTRQAFRLMKSQDPSGGRIINNGSLSAHVPRTFSTAYTASKHAVTGLTKSTSLDGRAHNIACGQIDIGNAATRLLGVDRAEFLQPDGHLRLEPVIDTRHVSEAVCYMAGLPLDVNVQFMTVMATTMPYIGRG